MLKETALVMTGHSAKKLSKSVRKWLESHLAVLKQHSQAERELQRPELEPCTILVVFTTAGLEVIPVK